MILDYLWRYPCYIILLIMLDLVSVSYPPVFLIPRSIRYVGLFGEVTTSGVWNVLHSTDPSLVGCTLVGSDTNSCSKLSIEGGRDKLDVGDMFSQYIVGCNQVVRKWEVVEIDGDSNLPGVK
jgi:hypothetical protein